MDVSQYYCDVLQPPSSTKVSVRCLTMPPGSKVGRLKHVRTCVAEPLNDPWLSSEEAPFPIYTHMQMRIRKPDPGQAQKSGST